MNGSINMPEMGVVGQTVEDYTMTGPAWDPSMGNPAEATFWDPSHGPGGMAVGGNAIAPYDMYTGPRGPGWGTPTATNTAANLPQTVDTAFGAFGWVTPHPVKPVEVYPLDPLTVGTPSAQQQISPQSGLYGLGQQQMQGGIRAQPMQQQSVPRQQSPWAPPTPPSMQQAQQQQQGSGIGSGGYDPYSFSSPVGPGGVTNYGALSLYDNLYGGGYTPSAFHDYGPVAGADPYGGYGQPVDYSGYSSGYGSQYDLNWY